MLRPFPLRWGIAALALFSVFAVVTQLQFSRISDDKIYAARLETYRSDINAYTFAVKANEDCLTLIETRETQREIFNGVSSVLKKSIALPDSLSPTSPEVIAYQIELSLDIHNLIDAPLEQTMGPVVEADCPAVPIKKPVPPTR